MINNERNGNCIPLYLQVISLRRTNMEQIYFFPFRNGSLTLIWHYRIQKSQNILSCLLLKYSLWLRFPSVFLYKNLHMQSNAQLPLKGTIFKKQFLGLFVFMYYLKSQLIWDHKDRAEVILF